MTVERLPFKGLLLLRPKIYYDERGYFFETYNEEFFYDMFMPLKFAQDNQSLSNKGVLRGLHFQNPPFDQGKLIRVISGAVLDMVVDIRKKSETFGKHYSLVMKSEDYLILWIPPGFAHGFVSLADNTIFSYKCTKIYHKESEEGILYNDPKLNINWNYPNPIVSEKDKLLPGFDKLESQF
jgi:dTDP-4-dehydrorhamnose 3,5-epimerase